MIQPDALFLPRASLRSFGREPGSGATEAYYEHRARSMSFAANGVYAAALPALEASWAIERPTAVEQASDLAWLYLLSGDPQTALHMVALGTRGQKRLPARSRELIGVCVALQPSLANSALKVCLSAGSAVDRVRALASAFVALARNVRAAELAGAVGRLVSSAR